MSAETFFRILLIDLQGHTLTRYRPVFMLIEAVLFLIAGIFWIAYNFAPDAFNAHTWGDWAYQFPARMWASLLMLASFTTFWGLVRPPARRMIVLGIALHVLNYGSLGLSAIFSGGDFAVALYAMFFMSMHALLGALIYRRGYGDGFSD